MHHATLNSSTKLFYKPDWRGDPFLQAERRLWAKKIVSESRK